MINLIKQKKKYIPALDVVRAGSILYVIGFHVYGLYVLMSLNGVYGHAGNISEFGNLFNKIANVFWMNGFIAISSFIILSGIGLSLGYQKVKFPMEFFYTRIIKLLIPFYNAVFLLLVGQYITDTLLQNKILWMFHEKSLILEFIHLIPVQTVLIVLSFPFLFDFSGYYLQQINPVFWYLPLIVELYFIYPYILRLEKKYSIKKY